MLEETQKMTPKTWGLLFVLFTSLLLGQAPTTERKTMKAVAWGKDSVLDYLANDARQRTGGKSGVYELYTDDAGNSMLIIDGHIFHGRPVSLDILPALVEGGGALPLDRNFIFERGKTIRRLGCPVHAHDVSRIERSRASGAFLTRLHLGALARGHHDSFHGVRTDGTVNKRLGLELRHWRLRLLASLNVHLSSFLTA